MWVSNGLMVWPILTIVYGDGGMQINRFVFSAPKAHTFLVYRWVL